MEHSDERSASSAGASPSALMVIDVQQGLFSKSTPIYRAAALLDTIAMLIDRAHASGWLVVFVQHASDKVLPFGSDDWQLHARLHPGQEDLVIHKQHGNAFEDTPLHAALSERGIGRGSGRVVVTGLVTRGCVRATCLGALDLGYAVTLVADAHSSYSKDAARLIEEWNRKLGEAGAQVMPASQVIF